MNPKYQFFLQLGDDGIKTAVKPNFSNDMAIEYARESGQQFFRRSLSDKFTFYGADYALIMGAPFDTEYRFFIEKSNDNGVSYQPYFTGHFFRTDCTINEYNRIIVVQPQTLDQYNDILAGIDKEFNLMQCPVAVQPLDFLKRRMLQIYAEGDDVATCVIGGNSFEQDTTTSETSGSTLTNTYHFERVAFCVSMQIIQYGASPISPDITGKYTGILKYEGTYKYHGEMYCSRHPEYVIIVNRNGETNFTMGIYNRERTIELFHYSITGQFAGLFISVAEGTTGAGSVTNWKEFSIYARWVCDKQEGSTETLYPIATDDIIADNRNYKYVTPYNATLTDNFIITERYTNEPTIWGKAPTGYYLPPNDTTQFVAVARTRWADWSFWYKVNVFDNLESERKAVKYRLRDTYPVYSCISALLAKIAPNITHAATPEYSEFLYAANNPIRGTKFNLSVTPKSNVLVGYYQVPAQKAPTTLGEFLTMLRNCFQLYWFIEDGKLRIEHISWFKNGGSYTQSQSVGIDLTEWKNPRNGKSWAYNTSEYTFEKSDMPERYEFGWGDETTEMFDGSPIEIVSKFVEAGKIENVNIGNFTADIDYMVLNPSAINQDGFALFASVTEASGEVLPIMQFMQDYNEYYVNNGILSLFYLISHYWLHDMPARRLVVNGTPTTAKGIKKGKKQTFNMPVGDDDPNPLQLVRTLIGNGQIEKMTINLSSRISNTTLQYETEQ